MKALLTYAVHVSRCPGDIAKVVTPTSSLLGRYRQRCASGNRHDHKFGEWALSCWPDRMEQYTYSHHRINRHILLKTVLELISLYWLIAYDFVLHLWQQGGDISHIIIWHCDPVFKDQQSLVTKLDVALSHCSAYAQWLICFRFGSHCVLCYLDISNL